MIIDSLRYWGNGKFRDDVRDFFRGEPGSMRRVADRIVGSPEIYSHKLREVEQSVNFVTCHDGFTLNDLVSYNDKHNEANGEDNRDGANDNRSWNCGVEGPTFDVALERLRDRQIKNFLTITAMSLGMPMILMGDEVRRTQLGNNNAYCQDNELSWFDWSLVEKNGDLHRFVRLLIARRGLRSTKHEQRRVNLQEMLREATKAWHGVKLNEPEWGDRSLSVALSAELREEGLVFYLILNAYWEPLTFQLPSLAPTNSWRRWIDTALDAPDDIVPWEKAPPVPGDSYQVVDRSVVMLFSQSDGREKVE
jgi:glycogen operon protein